MFRDEKAGVFGVLELGGAEGGRFSRGICGITIYSRT